MTIKAGSAYFPKNKKKRRMGAQFGTLEKKKSVRGY